MRFNLLLTGDELMSGDIVDSNSAMIAKRLSDLGWKIDRKLTVGDHPEKLLEAMTWLSQNSDVLLINGGLGPTVDDLTAEVLAKLIDQPLQENSDASQHLEQWCDMRGYQISDANRKQAILPLGVSIVPNGNGSAVGFRIEHNGCLIICTPGVPRELSLMLEEQILPLLQSRFDSLDCVTDKMTLFGIGESTVQQQISDAFPNWPSEIELGFRASLPTIELKLTSQSRANHSLRQQWKTALKEAFSDYLISEDGKSLAQALIDQLKQNGHTVTTAESCTGGLVASQLTEVAGSSAVFESGFVTYSNRAKTEQLGVDAQLLEQHGAVSEPVVRAMVSGALERSQADFGIAISGIAGPDGGSEEKPVGTVWLAWGSQASIQSREIYIRADRKTVQMLVAAIALDLIRRESAGITQLPRYLSDRWKPKGAE